MNRTDKCMMFGLLWMIAANVSEVPIFPTVAFVISSCHFVAAMIFAVVEGAREIKGK